MKLSVVILNYNVRYFLALCLQSVQAALKDIPSEIIVIDNNSPDDSCDMVRTNFPDIKLIENKENVGFSKANNQAVAVAKGEYICILNPDVVVAENTFHNLINFSKSKSDHGIIGCRLIDGSGAFLPESKRNFPTVFIAFDKLFGTSQHYYAKQIKELETMPVDVLPGALMFLKRSLYDNLGGFDEDFFMYGEDIDLSYRVQKLGLNNYYLGDTTIIHFKGESTVKNRVQSKRFFHAMKLFYQKHFNTNIVLNALISLITSLAPYFLIPNQSKKHTPKRIALMKPLSIQKWLEIKDIIAIESLDDLPKNSHFDVLFDAETTAFNSIINQIDSSKNKFITFKIHPKNSAYFVGSDSSKQRGEVIHFEKSQTRIYF